MGEEWEAEVTCTWDVQLTAGNKLDWCNRSGHNVMWWGEIPARGVRKMRIEFSRTSRVGTQEE